MTRAQLREALEAWRAGDGATIRRVWDEAQSKRNRFDAGEVSPEVQSRQDTADAFAYGIGPAFAAIQALHRPTSARQEFDVELIRKPDGSYGL